MPIAYTVTVHSLYREFQAYISAKDVNALFVRRPNFVTANPR